MTSNPIRDSPFLRLVSRSKAMSTTPDAHTDSGTDSSGPPGLLHWVSSDEEGEGGWQPGVAPVVEPRGTDIVDASSEEEGDAGWWRPVLLPVAGAPRYGPVVDPRLTEILHHPETADGWLHWAGRFTSAPFGPENPGTFGLNMNLQLNLEHALSWLDLWVFFCLATRVPMCDAVQGPFGWMSLESEFLHRRVRFRL
jgi:hypothetical protein